MSEIVNEKNPSKSVGTAVANLKSGATLLGVLYALVFLLMIPIFLSQGYTFNNMLINSALIVLAVIIVHFLSNGLYYMLVTIPFVLAVITFIFGWLIWIQTPLFFMIIDAVFGVINMFIPDLPSTNNLAEFFTRVGQTFMGIATGIWWLVKKVKDINYSALYIYIITLLIIGLFIGVTVK